VKLSVQMVVVLTSIGLLSGGFLTAVGLLTKDRIEMNKQREIEEAVIQVVPGIKTSQKLYEEKDLTVYGGLDEEGNLIGFGILASGIGFQDKITLMLGADTAFTKTNRMVILDQKETPGLGAKITDEDVFLRFWMDKDISGTLSLRKPAAISPEELAAKEVNTITGATISSQAVLKIVNSALERLRKYKDEGKLSVEEPDVK